MATIDTRMGPVEGIKRNDIHEFLGIRYGKPPAGAKRFTAPEPVDPWTETYQATAFGKRSIQGPSSPILGPSRTDDLDDDCLFLNIYTPGCDDKQRPVLFWIHGGAFTQGSGNEYYGGVLARQGDVVVVTINYRLGLLGFLNLEALGDEFKGSASNGFRDQILALQWVHDNIADYGGDAGSVTIFGESAGAGSVNSLLAAPSADGLYHKAISHSGSSASMPPRDTTNLAAELLGVEKTNLVATLRGLDGEALLDLQNKGVMSGTGVDGTVVTRPTYDAIRSRGKDFIPYIAGSNLNEGTLFTAIMPDASTYAAVGSGLAISAMDGKDPAPYIEGLKEIYGDDPKEVYEQIWNDLFRRPSTNMCDLASREGVGGWLYRFDLPSTIMNGALGATHACEIPFTFNTLSDPSLPGLGFHDANDPVVRQLAENWSNTVLAFARTGDPNGAGLPEWPPYTTDRKDCLIMDAQCRIEQDVDAVHEALWARVHGA